MTRVSYWRREELDKHKEEIEKAMIEANVKIPDELKKLPYPYYNILNHYYSKLIKKKVHYPICSKCREMGDRYNFFVFEYAMKRLYIKGLIYSLRETRNKTWNTVGWICPNCLNVIVDNELKEKLKKAKEESDERFKEYVEKGKKIMRGENG